MPPSQPTPSSPAPRYEDETLPFTAPADGDYRIAGKTYRLGAGTRVDEGLLPQLSPLRGCICSLGPDGSNPACRAFHPRREARHP